MMVRRPIKKRKPRKLSKTSSFQKVKELVERNFIAEPTPDLFETATPPKGKAYQWASIHPDSKFEFDCYKRAGWKPVPASRHPDFPSERGKIIFGGSMLLEISRKKYELLVGSGIARAKAQMEDLDTLIGVSVGQGGRFYIASSSFVVSEPYDHPPEGEFIDIPLTLTFRVGYRWQDAAACMKLTTEEYMQRRLSMYSHGIIPGLILPVTDKTDGDFTKQIPLELVENANLIVRRDK